MKSAPFIPIKWEAITDPNSSASLGSPGSAERSAARFPEETAFKSLIQQAITERANAAGKQDGPDPELLKHWSNQVMTTVNRHLMESFSGSSDTPSASSPLVDWSSTLSLALRLREYTQGIQGEAKAAAPEKTGTLEGAVDRASKAFQLPAKLIRAVIKAESNNNPKAVSPVGAKGLMQLMPGTAKELGVTDPFDADQNVMGGSKYLRQMLNRYNGNLRMALSAYNWGPGNLERKGVENLPSETRSYLARIAGLLKNDQSD